MKEKNNKVVYIHRKATDGTPFYVGMGTVRRPYYKSRRSDWWLNTYKKHGITVEIVSEGLSMEDAYELEVFLIYTIGRKDKGLGTLVNMTDGGDGAKGYLTSEEQRNIQSRKVINTETLEVLPSGNELRRKYGVWSKVLLHEHPYSDWMYLEDYNNEKHLTEKWINRYKIGFNQIGRASCRERVEISVVA